MHVIWRIYCGAQARRLFDAVQLELDLRPGVRMRKNLNDVLRLDIIRRFAQNAR